MAEHSLLLIKHIAQFKQRRARLVGHSRKSAFVFTSMRFLSEITKRLPCHLFGEEGVDYLRVHNVEMCAGRMRVMGAPPAVPFWAGVPRLLNHDRGKNATSPPSLTNTV